MVRNKQGEFLSYNKIVSQENFTSDGEMLLTVHTTVMHSSSSTAQCYTTVKAQNNNTNCHTKKKFKQYM
jgi:hypothetical protein